MQKQRRERGKKLVVERELDRDRIKKIGGH
jgi:hypothetical protein